MNKSQETIDRQQAEQQKLVDEYLARGGVITVYESGARTPPEDMPKPVWGKAKKK